MQNFIKTSFFIYIFIIFCSLNNAFAQSRFHEGEITNTNGKKEKGYIFIRKLEKTPQSIEFKKSIEDKESTSYSCHDLTEFTVLGDKYVSAIVESEISSRINNLSESPVLETTSDTTFVQVLMDGSKKLYYYKNEMGNENFYILYEDNLKLLTYKKYSTFNKETERKANAENKRYISELALYLNECPNTSELLKTTTYNKKNLLKLYKKYYNCIDEPQTNYPKKEKTHIINIGALAGATFSNLSFSSANPSSREKEYLHRGNFENKPSAFIGASFEYHFPIYRNKLSFYNELFYSSARYNSSYTNGILDNDVFESTINMNFIKMVNMIRFRFLLPNDQNIFINFGYGTSFTINSENEKTVYRERLGETTIEKSEAVDKIPNTILSFNSGIGYQYKNISIEGRYEISYPHYMESMVFSSKNKNYNIVFSYRFLQKIKTKKAK
ncbi:hypothetical protein [Aureibacter tunicatorum]|uniref:Outer membrane protein beta-barrel domain-containing protein n=1 Tax=Aureibacter tunicatorum TaxID=866807 RepID=A0AAE3XRQ8_9BACT|nr:hypothetical protein [Aureibacter tunicatorum]MDR6240809.1 hypothetical protein [Aureibacter tunicatorum]BDD06858.1 hypothetical protein AUTU_43410 [Aureibacter tunicatorum]